MDNTKSFKDNYKYNVVNLENGQLDYIEESMYVTRVDAELYINFTGGIKQKIFHCFLKCLILQTIRS